MHQPSPPEGEARNALPTEKVANIPAEATAAAPLELASRGMRFGARLLDDLIVVVVATALLWLILGDELFNDDEPSVSFNLAVAGLAMLSFIALNAWLLNKEGQTIGKRLVGLRIVALNGSRVPLARLLLLRYGPDFLFIPFDWLIKIWGLADSLAIFHPKCRCLHDLIAGTIVVKA